MWIGAPSSRQRCAADRLGPRGGQDPELDQLLVDLTHRRVIDHAPLDQPSGTLVHVAKQREQPLARELGRARQEQIEGRAIVVGKGRELTQAFSAVDFVE